MEEVGSSKKSYQGDHQWGKQLLQPLIFPGEFQEFSDEGNKTVPQSTPKEAPLTPEDKFFLAAIQKLALDPNPIPLKVERHSSPPSFLAAGQPMVN